MTADHHKTPVTHDPADASLLPPPDHANPAMIDLNTTFTVTVIFAALFIGAVVVFILR